MPSEHTKRIAILGREKQTINYRRALDYFHTNYEVTLSVGKLSEFDALLLPGGGDIDPKLLNEPDLGSRNIDTELDILQFQALDLFVKNLIELPSTIIACLLTFFNKKSFFFQKDLVR